MWVSNDALDWIWIARILHSSWMNGGLKSVFFFSPSGYFYYFKSSSPYRSWICSSNYVNTVAWICLGLQEAQKKLIRCSTSFHRPRGERQGLGTFPCSSCHCPQWCSASRSPWKQIVHLTERNVSPSWKHIHMQSIYFFPFWCKQIYSCMEAVLWYMKI